MRITIVNLYYPPDLSPTSWFAAGLAEHRAARGDEVTVLTGSGGYTGTSVKRGREQRGGVNVWRVAIPGRRVHGILDRALQYLAFYVLAAWRLLRLPRQDVIVSMTTPPFAARLSALHRLLHPRTRLVQWTADVYPDILEATGLIRKGGLAARGLGRIARTTLRRMDHVIASDEATRDRLAARTTQPTYSVIPMFEALARFPEPSSVPPWEGYKRLGLDERLVVLFIGNAGWGHDFGTMLQAMRQLADDPVSLLFVGGGMQHERVRAYAEAYQLPHVHLHPYVPEHELPSVVAGADLGLAVLANDALGMMNPCKIHTYLALSLPLLYLGPATSNVDDAIQRFACGRSLRQGDSDGVAAFVREAMRGGDRQRAMRRRAREAFEQAYSDRQVLPRLDAVLDAFDPCAGDPGAGVREPSPLSRAA